MAPKLASVFGSARGSGRHARPRPGIGKRRIAAAMSALLLVTMSVAGGLGITGDVTQEAAALAPLDTSPGNGYAITGDGQLVHVDLATGNSTNYGTAGTGSDYNGLGITDTGDKAYAFQRQTPGNGGTVRIWDAAADSWSSDGAYTITGMPAEGWLVAGAVNPVDDAFYFSGYDLGDNPTHYLAKYDPAASPGNRFSTVGRIPTSSTGNASNMIWNGDITFDRAGNMYMTRQNTGTTVTVFRVTAAALAGGGNNIASQQVAAGTIANNQQVNGIAYDADGSLYMSTGANLYKLSAGSTNITLVQAGVFSGVSDLASAASPATLTIKKNVVERVDPADQFTVDQDGTTTATTTGSATGIQAEAGPVAVSPGSTHTFGEVMAPGSVSSLSDYEPSWACSTDDPANPIPPGHDVGTGATGSIAIPNVPGIAVTCIIANDRAVVPVPAISIQKTAAPTSYSAAGDTITYSYLVTNTGNTPLSNVNVTDVSDGSGTLSAITCPADTLAPTNSTTCTATYEVTLDDVDAGSVNNTGTAHGTPPAGPEVTDESDATVTSSAVPGLSLVKSADKASFDTVGETITYSFLVTNTGGVTVSNLSVTDDSFTGTGMLSAINCPVTSLAPSGSTTCTATYQVTQADLDAGQILNAAHATGTPPKPGDPQVESPPSNANVPATQNPGLSLVKSVAPTTVHAAGQSVIYRFAVTNTGNVTIDDLSVTEDAFSGTGTVPTVTCPATRIVPGQTLSCAALYQFTQADVDAGIVENTATAHGDDPNSDPVASNPSDAVVDAPANPVLTITKSADKASFDTVGETITYSFRVTNTGNVTVSNLSVTEDGFSGSGSLSAVSCPVTSLAPSGSTTCTATYQVTQADLDAGQILNAAHATGTPPNPQNPPVESPPSNANVPAAQNPGLSLVKSADPSTVHTAGQAVIYRFAVTNTGNVTIDDLSITEDAFSGTGAMSAIACPATRIVPGQTLSCAALYRFTQADVDAGIVENTATAHGDDPAGGPVESNPSDAVVDAPANPGLTITKSADKASFDTVGETITYSFRVTNTGNVTVSNLSVTEDGFSGSGSLSAVSCPVTSLAPSGSTTCTATYQVTQADLDAGQITNAAHATGTPPDPDDPPVESPPSEEDVSAVQNPALSLVKSVAPTTVHAAGQSVVYRFAVTNTGNVTIDDLSVTEDAFSGTGTVPTVTCPATRIVPGQTLSCAALYQFTQADVDAGIVENTATAHGDDPAGGPVESNPSDAVVDAPAEPGLSLVKTAEPTTVHAAGETVIYRFAVTNTGNVTIDNLSVTEDAFSGTGAAPAITCPATSIAPGQTLTCAATYPVTQADMDDGATIVNTATAHGTQPPAPGEVGPGDPVDSNESDASVDVEQNPALALVKTSDTDSYEAVGEVITYTFTVSNTGNVTTSDIEIVEDDFSGTGTLSAITCPSDTLAPGESMDCTATYAVTQADLDAGQVANAAHATGTPPDPEDPPVESPPSEEEVPAVQNPGLALVKSVDPTEANNVGQQLTYRFGVENTGNVTVDNLSITEDAFSGTGTMSAVTCPVTTLAPGASTTCTATYNVTGADFMSDVGQIDNTATAHGDDPRGEPVDSEESSASVITPQRSGLELVKSAEPDSFGVVGDEILYSFEVTNTGNLPVSGITITELEFTGTGQLSAIDCGVLDTLLPDESHTCTAIYQVTEQDLAAGQIDNTAIAHGTDTNGNALETNASVATVPAQPEAFTPISTEPGHGTLPMTGAGILRMLGIAGVLVMLGFAGVTVSRRRRMS